MNQLVRIFIFFTFISSLSAQSNSDNIEFLNSKEAFEQLAKKDIQNRKIHLYYASGFSSVNYGNDNIFEKKYKITYYDFGCVAPKHEFLSAYNTQVFNYLSDNFGKDWLKIVRKDIPGLSEYKKSLESYKIACDVTYLPTIKSVSQNHKISKSESGIIGELLSNDSLIINLNQNDLKLFKEIAERADYQNIKIFNTPNKILEEIYRTKSIRLNLMLISNTKLNLWDQISAPIDGAPFNLELETKNNSVQTFSSNLVSLPNVNELGNYYLFYMIFQKSPFCNKINFGEYFSKENLYTLIFRYLSYTKEQL